MNEEKSNCNLSQSLLKLSKRIAAVCFKVRNQVLETKIYLSQKEQISGCKHVLYPQRVTNILRCLSSHCPCPCSTATSEAQQFIKGKKQ